MRALRRSIKGEKTDSRPQHISIAPKSDYAIAPPLKVIQAKSSWDPQQDPSLHSLSFELLGKYLPFTQGDFLHVTRQQEDGYYMAWYNDKAGGVRQGLVPINRFDEVAKQRASAGSSAIGTPSLPDSGYSTARSYGQSEPQVTPTTPKHSRMSSIARGAMVYGVVQYDFNAERPDELEAKAGETIIVIAQSNPEWFVAKPIGRLGGPGLIPVSFIEVKDMATGISVSDPLKAVQAAGVPKVEEWKRLAAEYKNSSISLGQLSASSASGSVPSKLVQGMEKMQIGNNGQQYADTQYGRSPQTYQHPSQSPQRLLAPLSASIPKYCFENDKYWYIIECVMEDGSHWELARFYQNFYDFQIKLLQRFPTEAARDGGTRVLPYMPGPVTYVTDAISNGRRDSLDRYIKQLLALPTYISHCHLVRELFAPREGDFELDPKAMQEDFRLSSASNPSDPGQRAQRISGDSSARNPYDNPYAAHAQGNPWLSQEDYRTEQTYSTNTSQSNQKLPDTGYANQNGSNEASATSTAPQVKVKSFFEDEDECQAFWTASDSSYKFIEGKVKDRHKLRDRSIAIQYEEHRRQSNDSAKLTKDLVPVNTDYDLSIAIQNALDFGRSLHLYVSIT